ncbi:MAG: toll/interleukin-1 receptor domain-containing protein [Anaerolineales bacterium]|nr:toll/interleukin-1 receptor domain-containing protein [Anaerolineales bacterium]
MTQVFISYSRRDLASVEKLAADLKVAGLDVWYDLSLLEAAAC